MCPVRSFRSLEALRTQLLFREDPQALELAMRLSHACWGEGRDLTDLGVLPGCLTSTAVAINRMNEVVGSAFDCQSGESGVLWSGGSIKDLNECAPPGGSRIVGASGINDAGQLIAWTSEARGVLLSPIDLGDIDGDGRTGVTDLLHLLAAWGRCACPADLNNDGQADHADLMLLVGNWSK